MAIRKIVSRSILDANIGTTDLDTTGTGTGAALMPKGTTAQRPGSPVEGHLRYNTTTGLYEQYTSVGWQAIDAPPTVSNISPTTYSGEQGTTITINGTNFKAGVTVKFIDNAGSEFSSPVVTFVSSNQITATTPQDFTVAQEPFDIKVTNPSGLTGILENCLDAGSSPSWTTASGNIYDGADDVAVSTSIAATDPDSGATLSYSVASGLPAGTSINTSTGAITGTPSTPVSSATTYTFNGVATDNAGNTNSRSFNIILRPTLDTVNSYPLSGSNYNLFTTAWTGSSSNLYDLGHASSTWRVPANVYAIRVLVWGGGGIWNNGQGGGYGGYTSAILRVTPGEYYKVIVAGGTTVVGTTSNGGYGGTGLGGGCSQDGNDNGVGGAGSGFFYAANSSGTTVTDEATMFNKGVLIAGGGGCAGQNESGGNGNGNAAGAQALTIAGISGYGIGGGGGGGNAHANGGKYNGNGGDQINSSGSVSISGGTRGSATGPTIAGDGYGSNCGGGGGGGSGQGGAGGGCAWAWTGNAEGATGDGGRGTSYYSSNYYNTSGPGMGGTGAQASVGGNGFRFNNINLGGGGGGGHGASNAGGGFGGGGSGYYAYGGGGGSGCAFGYMSGTTPTLSSWVNPNSVTVSGGNANSACGVPTTAGLYKANSSSGSGYNGAVLIMW